MDDDGQAISYKLLARGTAVHSSDGDLLGTVDQVLDNVRENIFDGIVIRTATGKQFVDAPEVARITEQRVTLSGNESDLSVRLRRLDASRPAAQREAPEPDSIKLER